VTAHGRTVRQAIQRGTPPEDMIDSSGQVSWLAGRRFLPAFPVIAHQ